MSISETQLDGLFYGGDHPVAQPVHLEFKGSTMVARGEAAARHFNFTDMKLSPRIGKADRFITFPDGSQCQCPDHPLLDQLPAEVASEGLISWLEAHVSAAISSIAIVVILLITGYIYGLPILTESIVERIPVQSEVALGEDIFRVLDSDASNWFSYSQIDMKKRDAIRTDLNAIASDLAMAPYITLAIRKSDIFGANALAIPGGTIIITDQMIELAQSQEEILAILAHELGHVEHRHSLQMVIKSSFAAFIATAVTGDAASLSAAVAGVPILLIQKRYSRQFEEEADTFAFNLLQDHGLSPAAFADIMERIHAGENGTETISFLSTHPVTDKRIQRARGYGSTLNKPTGSGQENKP
jgi:predicted Zn-dependent protease